jgi:hypothetical protein
MKSKSRPVSVKSKTVSKNVKTIKKRTKQTKTDLNVRFKVVIGGVKVCRKQIKKDFEIPAEPTKRNKQMLVNVLLKNPEKKTFEIYTLKFRPSQRI